VKPTLAVYVNGDDALLQWTVDELDPDCRGFAIERRRNRGRAAYLDNFAPPGLKAHQAGRHQGSDEWPVRAFTWTDHEVGTGDKVRYRIVPVTHGPQEALASAWSAPKTLGAGGKARAFFNRGFVISQFMSRYLDEHFPGLTREQALRRFKAQIGGELDDKLRVFLSGEVRTALLELLAGADDVHAALFELDDEELVRALERLGPRAHVVLANGSIEPRMGETTAQARTRDENAKARARLRAAGVEVHDRFVSPGPLAHNKFLVTGTRVWTGSTNWTTTGLCTQLNNALLIDDAAVAAAYTAQWTALRDAGSGHPPALAAANAKPAANVSFTRAKGGTDLALLKDVVAGAQQGVLFLMFVPGDAGVLADVRALAKRPEIVLRGVVSELPRGRADLAAGPTTQVHVTLFDEDGESGRTLDVVQPEGHAHAAAWWAAETTHQQFLTSVGHAIVHSKVLVVDPFTDHPVVVTGSHNFSRSASADNDENFIVVRGDRALAEAYAVNVANAWRHYAVRAGTAHAELKGIDYLRALLDDRRRDRRFWGLG
jgi:phosphatidylserine/phosphatidylglycerophosphate/cardiolipin synthase-like enzyme